MMLCRTNLCADVSTAPKANPRTVRRQNELDCQQRYEWN